MAVCRRRRVTARQPAREWTTVMPTSTVENYLKTLYAQQQEYPGEPVPLGKLAECLHLTPGTVTTMIKRLAESKLVDYETRSGARLTAEGERLALQVLRRHRLLELFLVKVVGFDWSEVHEEAEELEHAASEKLLEKIDAMLDHPELDPHGDPIPGPQGEMRDRTLTRLADCREGAIEIARISDHEPAFLQFLHDKGLRPGAAVTVRDRDPMADVVTLEPAGGEPIQLGMAAARKIFVLVGGGAGAASQQPQRKAAR
jgi:DtxR family Mn-dependent transcriptional regulator